MDSIKRLTVVTRTLNVDGFGAQKETSSVTSDITWNLFRETVLSAFSVVDYSDEWPILILIDPRTGDFPHS